MGPRLVQRLGPAAREEAPGSVFECHRLPRGNCCDRRYSSGCLECPRLARGIVTLVATASVALPPLLPGGGFAAAEEDRKRMAAGRCSGQREPPPGKPGASGGPTRRAGPQRTSRTQFPGRRHVLVRVLIAGTPPGAPETVRPCRRICPHASRAPFVSTRPGRQVLPRQASEDGRRGQERQRRLAAPPSPDPLDPSSTENETSYQWLGHGGGAGPDHAFFGWPAQRAPKRKM